MPTEYLSLWWPAVLGGLGATAVRDARDRHAGAGDGDHQTHHGQPQNGDSRSERTPSFVRLSTTTSFYERDGGFPTEHMPCAKQTSNASSPNTPSPSSRSWSIAAGIGPRGRRARRHLRARAAGEDAIRSAKGEREDVERVGLALSVGVDEYARIASRDELRAEGRLYRGLTWMRDELAPEPVLKASPIQGRRAAAVAHSADG